MNRLSLATIALSVLCLCPTSLLAQSQWINDLIGAMVGAGFDFNEVDRLRMAKLLADKGIINCQVVEWGKSVDAKQLSADERVEFLEERIKEFETKVNFVSRRLTGLVGENKQSVDLARSVARDNDLSTILDKVMPQMQSMVNKVKSELSDELEITRIVAGEYRMKFDSLCKKVKSLDDRVSILERGQLQNGQAQNGQGQYRALRPVAPDNSEPSNEPVPPRDYNNNGVIYPDRIVGDRSILCPSSVMIRKCYDYSPLEEINGRLSRRLYHGDLYADCKGYILVTHVKTGGAPTTSYQNYTYQVQGAPTLAPPLPAYQR